MMDSAFREFGLFVQRLMHDPKKCYLISLDIHYDDAIFTTIVAAGIGAAFWIASALPKRE